MKSLQDIQVFIETARANSFSEAARNLGQTPAAISKAIQRLESELGFSLFIRSTRRLRLSKQGEQYLPYCISALDQLQEGLTSIDNRKQSLSGLLKISMPSDTGRVILIPLLDEFLDMHPNLSVQVHLSDSYADIYSHSIDIALRFGEPSDSSLIAMPVAKGNRRILCASDSYIQSHPAIDSPDQLTEHNCLCFSVHEGLLSKWNFTHQLTGETKKVTVDGNRKASDGNVVRQWAINGRGVAYKSLIDIAEDLRSGALIEVCAEWRGENAPLYMVFANRSQYSPAVRQLREFLQSRLDKYLEYI
ncbi:LysR family transcriptional regulator [Vibrio hannami]|uniref:LysR family transcriptional regulator n=1 Tax=Vibrio hannami TaxID=2717094 RepID=UPI002410A2CB|nr:LysR family transcriptional regulator [Vibrio hannami]MDG3086483.1 LysR family transcriptional regulator [Vibrio hannami]